MSELRSIEAAFQDFMETVYKDVEIGQTQYRIMENCFYAGACEIFCQSELPEGTTIQDAIKHIEELDREIDAYLVKCKKFFSERN